MQRFDVTYLGWSGFRIDRPDGSLLLIDPPAGVSIPADRPLLVFITHGHPEHLGGVRAFLDHVPGNARREHGLDSSFVARSFRKPGSTFRERAPADASPAPITVCASADIACYLSRRSRRPCVTFVNAREDERATLADGVDVEIFRWKHLPLLPPGGVVPAAAHLLALASRPLLAARIVRAGIAGPRPDPMLGFRIIAGDIRILAYGEGLHRLCAPAEAAREARGCEGGTLLAAVEPEDAGYLSDLICAAKPGRVFLYEPHARWRDAFQMPRADLCALAAVLRRRGIETIICEAKTGQASGAYAVPKP